MFSCRQSSCVEYMDDESLPSPQFLQISSLGQDYASSLADINSVAGTELQPFQALSDSFLKQFSQSCLDVSDPSSAADLCASAASVHQRTSPHSAYFNG